MTWLHVNAGDGAERDAVLALKPEPYEVLRQALSVARRMADRRLLDLCRLRLAQLMQARAELGAGDAHLLAELERWESSSAFDETDRAALSYAEQYHYDHKRLSERQKDDLAQQLTEPEVANFVWALHMNDAYLRVLSLLDIAPDPPAASLLREQPATATDASSFRAVVDALGRCIVRQSLIDDVTSEAVRLHNASYQGCLY